jgi:hypothetical protein
VVLAACADWRDGDGDCAVKKLVAGTPPLCTLMSTQNPMIWAHIRGNSAAFGNVQMSDVERLLTVKEVARLESISVTSVYARLLAGEYDAYRDGPRTKVTEASVLRRRERLPKAEFGARRGIKGIPSKPIAADLK